MTYHKQETNYTCGSAAMRIALENCGIKKTEQQIVKLLGTNKVRGSWQKNFPVVAESFRLNYIVSRNASIEDLRTATKQGYTIVLAFFYPPEKVDHYTVVKKITKEHIYFWDPWFGPDHKYTLEYFKKNWKGDPRFKEDKAWFIGLK